MTCDVCHADTPAPHKAVINNVYYPHVCQNCVAGRVRQPNDAAYQRERGKDENAKEILQPFNRDGTPNADFVAAYPQEAKEIIGEENLKEF